MKEWPCNTMQTEILPDEALSFINDNISGGIVCTYLDEDYTIYSINDYMLNILGYSSEEYFNATGGKYINSVYPDDRKKVDACAIGTLSKSSDSTDIYRMLTKNGEIRWIRDTSKRIIATDSSCMMICLCVDVTKSLERQNELQMRNDIYNDIISSLPCGICKMIADEELTILYANEAYHQMFGYSEEEAKAAGFTSGMFTVCEEDTQKAHEAVRKAIAGGETHFEIELRQLHKSGKMLYILVRCNYMPELGQINSVVLDVTDRKHMEEQLRISEEEYRIATRHSSKYALRYDVSSKRAYLSDELMELIGLPAIIENLPYSMLDMLAPESRDAYMRLYEEIAAGKPEGNCVIKRKNKMGMFAWYKMDYTVIFDEEKMPLRAVVSYEDITELREKELAYDKWQQNFAMLPDESTSYYEFNLTQDICEAQKGSLLYHECEMKTSSMTEMVAFETRHFMYQPDSAVYCEFFNRERLLAAFYSKATHDLLEYRRKKEDGSICWVKGSIQMVQYPYSSDVKAYVLFEDIDAQKKEALRMKVRSTEDALTGALNRAAFIEQTDALMELSSDQQHALIMIDIDKLKQVNDTLGHIQGDNVLSDMVQNLKSMLRTDDIIGRLGGDEFMLCLINVPHDGVVDKRARLLVKLIEKQLTPEISVSGSLGIAIYPRDGKTFNELYQNADIALYNAKAQGGNRHMFYHPDMAGGIWSPSYTPIDDTGDVRRYNDNAKYVDGIVRDNNELLQKQNNDERYRIIMEKSGTVIFELDFVTGAFFASEGFKEYTFTQQEIYELLRGTYTGDSIHADDRVLVKDGFIAEASGNSNEPRITLRLKKTDGTYEWSKLGVICVRDDDGKTQRAIGVINRVDFMKENAGIQLNALMNYMAGGVLMFEVDTPIHPFYISPSYYNMAETNQDEFAENNNDLSQLVYYKDKERFDTALKEGAKTGQLVDIVYRNIFSGGGIGWRHMRAVRIPYGGSDKPVLIAVITDVSELKQTELAYKLEKERIQITFDLCSVASYECDISEHTIYRSRAAVKKYDIGPEKIVDMPESAIRNGGIHPDSADDIRRLYDDIYAGVENGSCIVKVRKTDGSYGLVRTSYKSVYDEDGKPYRTVGISEDVANVAEARLKFEHEDKLKSVIAGDFISVVKANLSCDTVEYTYVNDITDDELSRLKTYTEIYNFGIRMMQNLEECVVAEEKLSLGAMKRSFAGGNEWINMEYRRRDSAGRLVWVAHRAHMMINPDNGDLYGFIYQRNIDDKKRFELALPIKAERSMTNGLYTAATMRAFAQYMLAETIGLKRMAIAVLDIVDFIKLRTQLGTASMDSMLLAISRKAQMHLKKSNFMGYMGEGRFMLLFTDVPSQAWLQKDIEELIHILKIPMLFTTIEEAYANYRIGCVYQMDEGWQFADIYADAIIALESIGDKDGDTLRFFDKTMHECAPEEKGVTEHSRGVLAILGGDEDTVEAFLDCTSSLLTADTLDNAMAGLLRYVGEYYRAERAYILEYDGQKHTINNTYEWCADGVKPQKDLIQNVDESDLPLLQRALINEEPFAVGDAKTFLMHKDPEKYTLLRRCGVESIYCMPFSIPGSPKGFLGVDNQKAHRESDSLVRAISYFVISEIQKRRAIERQSYLNRHDMLTGLLNRESYAEYCTRTKPESLSSLGVLVVDLNGLHNFNRKYGNVYGDNMLVYISGILLKYFAPNEVYRMGGSSFLVLCAGAPYDMFMDRIAQIRNETHCNYQGCYSLGCTWTDMVQNFEKLIDDAEEMMMASKREMQHMTQIYENRFKKDDITEIKTMLSNGQVHVFLQPKVTIADGKVSGAEALSRIILPDRGMIMPAKFIPRLEKIGLIRYIDFFVLEEVCKLLERWKQQGRTDMEISLNFSRATLLEPGVMESMLDIVRRYDIDRRCIEIEITESLGDLEWETITRIGRSLMQVGFRLSLDDFGSKYSNLFILSTLDFSAIKLDKSLVDHVVSNKMSCSVIKSVVDLCDQYGMAVVAEGVETQEQLDKIRELGCGYAQGYIFNKPIPIADFERAYI
ncbi:MAG: EAL domain-containing protein [Clostridia bacterium]